MLWPRSIARWRMIVRPAFERYGAKRAVEGMMKDNQLDDCSILDPSPVPVEDW